MFLAAYINQPDTQAKLSALSKGSSMRTISKIDIERLQISMPEAKSQDALAGLYDTIEQYKASLQHKYTLMDQIFTATTSQITKERQQ
jgi:restriction endonuclease S subunit